MFFRPSVVFAKDRSSRVFFLHACHANPFRQGHFYKLANDGHDTRSLQTYLGHKNIQNTTRYTALAPDRFKGFWKD